MSSLFFLSYINSIGMECFIGIIRWKFQTQITRNFHSFHIIRFFFIANTMKCKYDATIFLFFMESSIGCVLYYGVITRWMIQNKCTFVMYSTMVTNVYKVLLFCMCTLQVINGWGAQIVGFLYLMRHFSIRIFSILFILFVLFFTLKLL